MHALKTGSTLKSPHVRVAPSTAAQVFAYLRNRRADRTHGLAQLFFFVWGLCGSSFTDRLLTFVRLDEPALGIVEAPGRLAVAFALEECRTEVPTVFPYLEPALQSAPDEGFYAISVTSGGASILIVPPDARP